MKDEEHRAPTKEMELAVIGEQLPLRLIDVFGTILSSHKGNVIFENGSSKGWDFHVISHTWSKAIRDLSEEVGKLVIHDRLDVTQPHELVSSAPASCPVPSCSSSKDAYAFVFKDADFSEVSSYKDLREFLQLLAGDGVKYVWFDALCIDQTNVDEKSREICNMGTYYHRSRGCYVLTHGVGEGYQLWGKQGPRGAELPRWFSRVWTLQEFLLPRQLSFFVEGLDPRFLSYVNKLARAKSKSGVCRCFCGLSQREVHELSMVFCHGDELPLLEPGDESMKNTDSDEFFRVASEDCSKRNAKLLKQTCKSGSLDRQDKFQMLLQPPVIMLIALLQLPIVNVAGITAQADPKADQAEVLSSTNASVCMQCQSLPIIRRARIYKNDVRNAMPTSPEDSGKRKIYLVDREAYLAVMHCDSLMMEPRPSGHNTKGVQELRGLYAKLLSPWPWRAWDVIVEVGRRNCSVEEDRVLGILGLLGRGGGELSQLRSGKGLQEQVRDLAKACSPEMLVELCGMDARACGIPRMSWAPHFHDPTCHGFWVTHVRALLPEAGQNLSVEVERVGVSASGALTLRAKVVRARVLPVAAMPTPLRDTPFVKSILSPSHTFEPCSHFIVIPPPPCHPHNTLALTTTTTLDSFGFIPLCCMADPASSTSIKFEFFSSAIHKGSMQLPINAIHGSAIATTPNRQHCNSNSFIVNDLSFDVEMVLLAGTNRARDGGMLRLIMLCLKRSAAGAAVRISPMEAVAQESDQELDKIGMLSLITNPDFGCSEVEMKRLMLHFEKANMEVCTIGGFGADISAHVQ